MWYIISSIVLSILAGIKVGRSKRHWLPGVAVTLATATCTLIVFSIPILGFTTGLCPNYGKGVLIGRVVNLREQGIIYKTYEGEIQYSTNSLTTTTKTLHFSIQNSHLFYELVVLQGRKVALYYNKWLITPFKIGSSRYVVTSVREESIF